MAADRCSCGSTDLFSGHFDAEGLAHPVNVGDATPAGVAWKTVCNSCGDFLPERSRRGSIAPGVSRALAKAGMRPLGSGSSRMREGVRVSRGLQGGAYVHVDFDSAGAAARRTDELAPILETAGYKVERVSDSILSVTKGGPA